MKRKRTENNPRKYYKGLFLKKISISPLHAHDGEKQQFSGKFLSFSNLKIRTPTLKFSMKPHLLLQIRTAFKITLNFFQI